MRKLLIWMVVTIGVLIAAVVSSSIRLSVFCVSSTLDHSSEELLSDTSRVLLLPATDGLDANGSTIPESISEKVGTGCDYTQGKWVKSDRRPLYSGTECKQWLAPMWACRLMPGRPSFEYENYRWQPGACDLPTFKAEVFLSRMKNKVIAFVGDSIGRQQYQSLMCMLTGGKDDIDVQDVGEAYGLVKQLGSVRPEGVAHRFVEANTTIIYYWSASLCDIQPLNETDPNTEYAMHIDRPVMFVQEFLRVMDVLVLNTGHHWNRGKINANKWVMHVNGQRAGSEFRTLAVARNYSMTKIVSWLDNEIMQNKTEARIYVRSLSPRHFFEGEWDSGGRCDNNMVPVEEKNVAGQIGTDAVAEDALKGTNLHLLNITYISLFRDEAHISRYRANQKGQDCLHWCLPGVPDVWNEVLYAKLLFDGETG